MTISKIFIVQNKVGLHARPAAKFVRAAAAMKKNTVWIENKTKGTPQVNAKSFTGVLSISVQMNDQVIVTLEGEDVETSMCIFTQLFDSKFGEPE